MINFIQLKVASMEKMERSNEILRQQVNSIYQKLTRSMLCVCVCVFLPDWSKMYKSGSIRATTRILNHTYSSFSTLQAMWISLISKFFRIMNFSFSCLFRSSLFFTFSFKVCIKCWQFAIRIWNYQSKLIVNQF